MPARYACSREENTEGDNWVPCCREAMRESVVKGVDMHTKILTGLLLLGLLTVVLASCGIREASPVSGPTAKSTGANFLQDKITIKKGESIIFMNESSSPHL